MSGDSEAGPSPLPSPIFARCSPARGTVARKCREFFLKRLERTATMQKRWSICEPPRDETGPEAPSEEGGPHPSRGEGFPLRKCNSSLDLAMDSLRREISSLITQDNDLFRKLLSLHDSIAELRERQRHSLLFQDDDDDYNDDIDLEDDEAERSGGPGRHSHSPSLESLSDQGDPPETSPESTLSSRSSRSADTSSSDYNNSKPHHHHHHHRHYTNRRAVKQRRQTSTNGDSRPITFIDKSEICFRCRKLAPPYRRSTSIASLYYNLHEHMDSYDSGIHLQGSHSDSDHEIFV